MFNKILEAFPPPRFLSLPFSGVAISDSAVRCIQFGRRHGSLYIEKYAEKKLPPGVVISGEINNPDELINTLSSLKKELNLNYVRVSLPEERAYLFTAKIPIVKQKEVRSAIESKMEENVPVSPTELTYDYKLFHHKQKQHLDIVVSCLPVKFIDNYVEIIKKAGLYPLSLEIESQAIVRALLPPNSFGTSLIIHFNPDKVGLYVESFGVVRFTSTIPLKGELATDPNFLSAEIKKLFVYWHTLKENIDKPDNKITRIIACGENFDETTISYLSGHNKTAASIGNVWINAFNIEKKLPEISFNDSLKYTAAVGLALPTEALI